MSTRSGKRIHGSSHENMVTSETEIAAKCERKTRKKRMKENDEVIVPKIKKRNNYVSYPAEDDAGVTVPSTLKEQDLNAPVMTYDLVDPGKMVRVTRRTKKNSEHLNDDVPVTPELMPTKTKKKTKKKKQQSETEGNENENPVVVPKKSKRKKGGKANHFVEEDITPEVNMNKSNGSVDSFHSAAGSPTQEDIITNAAKLNGSYSKAKLRASKRMKAESCEDIDHAGLTEQLNRSSKKIKLSFVGHNLEETNESQAQGTKSCNEKDTTFAKSDDNTKVAQESNATEKKPRKKRKSSVKNTTLEKTEVEQDDEIILEKEKRSLRSQGNKCTDVNDTTFDRSEGAPEVYNGTTDKELRNRRKSSINNATFEKTDLIPSVEDRLTENNSFNKSNYIKNSTFEKTGNAFEELNKTFEKELKRRSSIKNSTFEKIASPVTKTSGTNESPIPRKLAKKAMHEENKGKRISLRLSKSVEQEPNSTTELSKESPTAVLNGTFEKSNNNGQSVLNSTYEKTNNSKESSWNNTFEKSKGPVILNSTFENNKNSRRSLNTTFESTKNNRQSTLNSTFDKSKESTLNSTYEKTKSHSNCEKNKTKSESSKSSLISSDNTSDLTLDKSDDNSRISITSDDSRTENIVNTTPLLIESSMDESKILEIVSAEKKTTQNLSTTPLKREGTFTKDGPDVVMSPMPKVSRTVTPVKRMSLPSPGSTPFPFSKSSQKERCMLNVTRSIEKSRRASLAEPSPRTTRVMFCSPINNPVVVMQQKKKVIKSSLKGSNKSFVFDESLSEGVRPAARKRSYTHSDAEEARSKRKRLADPQQQSVDRLSRPRTVSATVKLSEPSTPSKSLTPLKKTPGAEARGAEARSRGKLPNFAALHQREFDKMESLDECQRRRARRAKDLLTPRQRLARATATGGKVSTTEPVKAFKEAAKKSDTPAKTPKVPTLMSLRPGYTRFGFKMDVGVNPFSVPPKTDIKPKEKKPNGLLTRQPTLPSLTGTTASRKDVAKQTVMREKSFTSLSIKRNVTRTENRSMIKGVRTNRRFELQMMMRNINP